MTIQLSTAMVMRGCMFSGVPSAFADRIQWILNSRPREDTGRPWTVRQLSLATGASPAWLGETIRRELDPSRSDRKLMERLAEIARVSPRWLIYGKGDPSGAGSGPQPVSAMAQIEAMAQAMRAAGPAEVIDAALAALRLDALPETVSFEMARDRFDLHLKRAATLMASVRRHREG